MSKNHLFAGTLSLAALLTGCLDDQPADDVAVVAAGESDDDDDIGEAAFCPLPPTPPAPDLLVRLHELPGDQIFLIEDYGTTSCSWHTTAFRGSDGYWNLLTGIGRPTDEATCEGVKLSYFTYFKYTSSGPWNFGGSSTSYGKWNGTICLMPEIAWSFGNFGKYETRVTAKLQTTTCSGDWCATRYGRPIFYIAAW